jgi:hypothetical protein
VRELIIDGQSAAVGKFGVGRRFDSGHRLDAGLETDIVGGKGCCREDQAT